jgi:hypothetical protein
MSQPAGHRPQTARFLIELSVAVAAAALVALYAVPRWQGLFAPLKPAAEAVAGSPDPANAAARLLAPEKIKIMPAAASLAISVVAEAPAPAKPGQDMLPEVDTPPAAEKTAPNPRLKHVTRPGAQYFDRQLPPEKKGPPKDPRIAEAGSAADPASEAAQDREMQPVILERPSIEPGSPALARERPPTEAADDGLDPRTVILCVGGLFAVVFLFLMRALSRGPGGKGLSFD